MRAENVAIAIEAGYSAAMENLSFILALVALLGSSGFGLYKVKHGLEVDIVVKLVHLALVQTAFLCLVAWIRGWEPSRDAILPWAGVAAGLWFFQVIGWELISESFVASKVAFRVAGAEGEAARSQARAEGMMKCLTVANERLRAAGLNPVMLHGGTNLPDLVGLSPEERKLFERGP